MRSVAVLPSVALIAGVLAGTTLLTPPGPPALPALLALLVAVVAWRRNWPCVSLLVITLGFAACGACLGADAARRALDSELRQALDASFDSFSLDGIGPGSIHPPLLMRGRLLEDAVQRDYGVSMRMTVERVAINGVDLSAGGGVLVTVNGEAGSQRVDEWRGGRTLEMPVTFRRPARYLNDGVPDFEREAALDGTALLGTVKSGLLVDVVARGGAFQELAAGIRAHVRRAISARLGSDAVRAAIVTAILIGDRTGLPPEIRERLQAAGTYHVIAISGGNIAILAGLLLGLMALVGVTGRTRALLVIAGLALYAAIVTSGPSVWRATLTAITYLAARLLDQRSPPWNAMAVSAAVLACAAPLDVRSVGFALTFGATAAMLEGARRITSDRRGVWGWVLTMILTSLAIEIVLLPIAASAFSRVTMTGLVLNLLAVPLMTIAQLAGLLVVFGQTCSDVVANGAGWVASQAAGALISTAGLVDVVPWLSPRVSPPSLGLVALYQLLLAAAIFGRRYRRAAVVVLACLAFAIVTGQPRLAEAVARDRLRLTVFDVGQGDAMLLQTPDGHAIAIDTGGVGFAGSTFDIGTRVLAPALWARSVRGLDVLALTHGDPDHIGGALAVIRDFSPRRMWEGIEVPRHVPSTLVRAAAKGKGEPVEALRAGEDRRLGEVRLRVLHPSPPDWERVRVRNDDSLVIEVLYRDVSILLTGDIGADIEREIVPQLAPARVRILKVAHHGSRTSTSPELLAAWPPDIAVISCGRGNPFGHPHPEVISRLAAAGSRILRTDRDGQITLDTDGHEVHSRTYVNK